MVRVLLHAKIHTGNRTIPDGFIRFNKQIISVGPFNKYVRLPKDQIKDVSGITVVPGFIDIHTHGGYGADSMNPDPEVISHFVDQMAQEGVTSVFFDNHDAECAGNFKKYG